MQYALCSTVSQMFTWMAMLFRWNGFRAVNTFWVSSVTQISGCIVDEIYRNTLIVAEFHYADIIITESEVSLWVSHREVPRWYPALITVDSLATLSIESLDRKTFSRRLYEWNFKYDTIYWYGYASVVTGIGVGTSLIYTYIHRCKYIHTLSL